jgi:formamidopyrimidine-DNA glycosylase
MPELPEVEFARRSWQRWAARRRVKTVTAAASRVLRPATPRALEVLRGATFVAFDRRGKNLLLTARKGRQDVGVWSHLGMTGKWLRRKTGDEQPRFVRAAITLDDGHTLYYCDMRLFGRLQIVPGAHFDALPEVAGLGPDPLGDGIDRARLAERLAKSRLPIKVVLLDQRILAGVGNIQAGEALFRARLDPRRPASSLTRPEVGRLATGIEKSLQATLSRFDEAVGPGGDIEYVEEGAENPFLVYDRAGERCPRKNGEIQRIVQAGRSTFFCPACFKPPGRAAAG